MFKKFRLIIFSFLLLILFLEVFVGFPKQLEHDKDSPENQSAQTTAGDSSEKEMSGTGIHYVESRGGHKDWELFSDSAEGSGNKGQWDLNKVNIHFYQDDKLQFRVSGEKGKIDTETKDMTIQGKVITTSANGYRFESPILYYKAKLRTLHTPEKVKMTSPPDSQGSPLNLTGLGMESPIDRNIMKILKNVRAEKKMSDQKEMVITSEQALFSSIDNSAHFSKKVLIEYQKMKIEGPEADFFYKTGTDFFQSIQVRGGARLSDPLRQATSDTLQFDPDLNQMVLKGSPRVVQNEDEVLGDEIIFTDGGRKVKVKNLKAHVEKDEK